MNNILSLWPFVLLPAAILAILPPLWRRIFFVLGLMITFGAGYVTDVRGADNPGIIYPVIGLGIAIGALLVEAISFAVRMIRRLRVRR